MHPDASIHRFYPQSELHPSSVCRSSCSNKRAVMVGGAMAPALCRTFAPSSSSARFLFAFRVQALGNPQCHSPRLQDSRARDCSVDSVLSRRQACFETATVLASVGLLVINPDVAGSREVEVGSYLPASNDDSRFVQFRASTKDTPALRAGNVQPYEFVLPPTWKQERVANILSGNYCQPKCAEPWVEVKFADAKQGAIQVVAAPMVRLTNKPNATIEEIGSPEKILAALGPFVTGNSFDPDEVAETSVQRRGDQTYYSYHLETPYAKTGAHNLATATAKGSVVMLFVVSANDVQWSSSEKLLRSIAESFGV